MENIGMVAVLQTSILCLYNFCQSQMPCIGKVADMLYEIGQKKLESKQG